MRAQRARELAELLPEDDPSPTPGMVESRELGWLLLWAGVGAILWAAIIAAIRAVIHAF